MSHSCSQPLWMQSQTLSLASKDVSGFLDTAGFSIFLPAISCLHAFAWAVPPSRQAIPFKFHCLLEAFSDLPPSVVFASPARLRAP